MKNQVRMLKDFSSEKKYYMRNLGLFVHQGFLHYPIGENCKWKHNKNQFKFFFICKVFFY